VGGSAWLVLIGHVSGLSRVASLDTFVRITLHLLAGLGRLGTFVRIKAHLIPALLARCGLRLLRHRRKGDRASGNDNYCEN